MHSIIVNTRFREERRSEIAKILAEGKSVRFTHTLIPEIWKEVSKFEPDDVGDLLADRISDEALCQWICWDGDRYSISAVDKT